jgi:hypothetical protein
MLRPVEFGLFPTAGSDPAVAIPILQTLEPEHREAAVA